MGETPVEGSSFLSILESIIPSANEDSANLNRLWTELPDLEKSLIGSPTLDNLKVYTEQIQKILRIILQKNHKNVEVKRNPRSMTKHTITKIVDEKLHLLATTIISKNNSAFELLKQTRDIRGLLADQLS